MAAELLKTSYIIVCCFFYVSFVNSLADLKEGADCHYEEKNTPGICVELKHCTEVLQQIKQNKLPQICRYKGHIPIVCCEKKSSEVSTQVDKNRIGGEISKKKCKEYEEQLVYKKIEIPIFSAGSEPTYATDYQCSIPTFVHGGENADPKEFPHMTLLGYGPKNNIKWRCGGSLISERFVLTAAHCLSERELGVVRWARLGDLDYIKTDDDAQPQEFSIAETFRHPGYKRPSRYNDIALIQLEKAVRFTDYVRPACLHTDSHIPVNKYIVTGWGHLAHNQKQLSDILQKAIVDDFTIEECNVKYAPFVSKTKLQHGIVMNSQICAGGKTHDRDTCPGDSGGPLQIYHPHINCSYSLLGVTSFGQPICGVTGIPAIYTRVSHYIDWIEKIVWP